MGLWFVTSISQIVYSRSPISLYVTPLYFTVSIAPLSIRLYAIQVESLKNVAAISDETSQQHQVSQQQVKFQRVYQIETYLYTQQYQAIKRSPSWAIEPLERWTSPEEDP